MLAALSAANLPFISPRLMAVIVPIRPKSLVICLFELVAYYLMVGGLGLLLEKRVGQIASQAWEFYAITATVFLTFAFPGFVYRYLFKHHH